MDVDVQLKQTTDVDLIYKYYESIHDEPREHLGASLIGDPCKRKLWYSFRWVLIKKFDGRMLRLFERGKEEETKFNNELRAIGCKVIDLDPSTGKQYTFADCMGHFGGSMDAALLGLRESPKTWHVGEYKTSNDKKFQELCKNKVEKAQPRHYSQMQCYMGWSGMERALYLCTNKNDDSIYQERVKFDREHFEKMRTKALEIIKSPEPLEKLSDDPAWYQCKMCEFHSLCHENRVAQVNCRTCAHSTPIDGGKWKCEALESEIDKARQMEGCPNHLMNPKLVPYAEMVDADQAKVPKWVQYKKQDGKLFYNIVEHCQMQGYTSGDLHALAPSMVGDETLYKMKVEFNASFK